MEVKDQAAVTVAQPVVTQTPKDHVTITIDQPVTQLPQEEEDKKNKFLVVASNGCMVRKTPDFDSPLVKVLDHNSVIETTTAEPALTGGITCLWICKHGWTKGWQANFI
eukprot:CAMPEP_0117826158 /NCGR_PEP_ID=MMETSP0949-20121206/5915_1 /TAXON_ID=44440 /ORGANISM="Chattonella subsalsa, Strain CCMP2191" /LENGTH=108 /DNA_ID=CAMNT_0005666287 /DNA_START=189 /DNA_END=515 /DNA_ORIENTATION=+